MGKLNERFEEEKVCYVACNVTDEQQLKCLFDTAEEFFKVSCVDILVNNAWINTYFGWRKCMAVNIMADMMGTVIFHGENEELSLDWEKRWLNE